MKGYKEIDAPVIVAHGQRPIYNKAYEKGDLRIWISRELYHNELRWHMSISCQHRYPVWDEIRDAWYALAPQPECANVTVGMLLPPKGEYVNLHKNCFHLHEIVD